MSDLHGGSVDRVEESALHGFLNQNGGFFRTVNRQLAVHLARLGVPPRDREGLIGQAWLRAVQHCCQFASVEPAQLRCWLMKTVHRLALDRKRRLVKRFCESLDAGVEEPIDEAQATFAEMAEITEHLSAMLEKLGPGNETNVRLLREHFFQGRSIQELAQQFDMTEDAVYGRIHRLLEKVRELWEENFSS